MWTYNHTSDSNELYHYGVPGMKWGVRRAEKRAQRKAAREEKRARKLADKKAKRDKYLSEREEDLKDGAYAANKAIDSLNMASAIGKGVALAGAAVVAAFATYAMKQYSKTLPL